VPYSVIKGLSAGWENLNEKDPLATAGGPVAKTQEKVEK